MAAIPQRPPFLGWGEVLLSLALPVWLLGFVLRVFAPAL